MSSTTPYAFRFKGTLTLSSPVYTVLQMYSVGTDDINSFSFQKGPLYRWAGLENGILLQSTEQNERKNLLVIRDYTP